MLLHNKTKNMSVWNPRQRTNSQKISLMFRAATCKTSSRNFVVRISSPWVIIMPTSRRSNIWSLVFFMFSSSSSWLNRVITTSPITPRTPLRMEYDWGGKLGRKIGKFDFQWSIQTEIHVYLPRHPNDKARDLCLVKCVLVFWKQAQPRNPSNILYHWCHVPNHVDQFDQFPWIRKITVKEKKIIVFWYHPFVILLCLTPDNFTPFKARQFYSSRKKIQ